GEGAGAILACKNPVGAGSLWCGSRLGQARQARRIIRRAAVVRHGLEIRHRPLHAAARGNGAATTFPTLWATSRERPDPGLIEVGGWTKTRPISLGLLPSGPDPVGEWNVQRQPPVPYIGDRGRLCKPQAEASTARAHQWTLRNSCPHNRARVRLGSAAWSATNWMDRGWSASSATACASTLL